MMSPEWLEGFILMAWVLKEESIVTHTGLCLQWEKLVNWKPVADEYLGEMLDVVSRGLSQVMK